MKSSSTDGLQTLICWRLRISKFVTYADTTPLEENFGYKPSTLREGLRAFAEWFQKYYL